MQGSVHQGWLGRRCPCRVPWKSLSSLGSLFSPILHSPRMAKTADQSTNKSIALYNLSRRREDWVFCSNSAFQVWFGLRTCFGDSALQVPLPTQQAGFHGSFWQLRTNPATQQLWAALPSQQSQLFSFSGTAQGSWSFLGDVTQVCTESNTT